MGVIYVRPNLINGKKYVGQATNLKVRQRAWKNLNKSYAGTAINNARAKYGIDNFGFEILKECDDKELDYWEKYYIKELNTKAPYGYNMTDGGEGRNGSSVSEETRKKLSECNKGKHHSEETRKKISENNKGKIFSEKTRKKMSEAHKGEKSYIYGKHLSEETRKKMSKAKKGKKLSEEHKKKLSESQKNRKIVIQIDKNTNEIIAEFSATMEVKRQLGYSQSNISKCCSGKIKSAYGFIWKYKEESVA